jgi:hypothetical protein
MLTWSNLQPRGTRVSYKLWEREYYLNNAMGPRWMIYCSDELERNVKMLLAIRGDLLVRKIIQFISIVREDLS